MLLLYPLDQVSSLSRDDSSGLPYAGHRELPPYNEQRSTTCKLLQKERLLNDIMQDEQKHTTGGIPRWSPTLVLVARFSAYVWQSGRDAQFSLTYGRMCWTE
jgi:hypothetical protein